MQQKIIIIIDLRVSSCSNVLELINKKNRNNQKQWPERKMKNAVNLLERAH